MIRFHTMLLFAALAAPALPAAAETPAAISVRHADLNLDSNDGRAMLERRIASAARTVCEVGDDRMLSILQAERRCVRGAVGEATQRFAGLDQDRMVQLALSSPAPVARPYR